MAVFSASHCDHPLHAFCWRISIRGPRKHHGNSRCNGAPARSHTRLAILWTAFFMTLFKPEQLWWDAGFQLSFAAVIGVTEIGPRFQKAFAKIPETLGLRDSLAMTLSAQLTTPSAKCLSSHRSAISSQRLWCRSRCCLDSSEHWSALCGFHSDNWWDLQDTEQRNGSRVLQQCSQRHTLHRYLYDILRKHLLPPTPSSFGGGGAPQK